MATKILAISGSLRAHSSNTAILMAAKILAPAHSEIIFFSGLDLIPHFNPDLEAVIYPALEHFRQEIITSDAILICSPEYAHGIPGTLKNALDWIVSSGELDGKAIGIINATPLYESKSYAQESLIEILKTMSAKILPENTLAISQVKSKLGKDGEIIDLKTIDELTTLINSLLKTIIKVAN
ncbi:MAG: NADPH-dependent FMN reductase [Bacteriovorax sp.]|nr:NADPH-dependent FMN reductase [Bacteriovorax sp.]